MTTKTKTTEPERPARVEPRIRLDARGWRSVIAGALATIYVVTWLALEAPTAEPVASAAPTPAALAPRVVWLDSLPLSERPPLVLPAGWELVSREAPIATEPPRAARSRRVARIRTRSS